MNLDLTGLSVALPADPAAGLVAQAGTDIPVVPFTDLMGLLSVPVGLPAPVAETDTRPVVPDDERADDAAPAPDAAMAMPAMAAVPPQLLANLGLPSHLAQGPAGDAGERAPTGEGMTGEAEPARALAVSHIAVGPDRMPRPQSLPAQATPTPPAPWLEAGPAALPALDRDASPPSGTHAVAPAPMVADAAGPAASAPASDARRVAAAEAGAAPTWLARAAEALPRDGEPVLALAPTTPAQWRQPLADALGERLQFSVQRGFDQAVIRLDPPQLGRIEIAIRHEAGALQVHMTATHGEVVRQLNAIGDSLRQDLGQRQYGEVSVSVSDAGAGSGRDAEGRPRGRLPDALPDEPGRALAEAQTGPDPSFRLAHDFSETP
jgi:flagellar hook-length control protein FliK